MTHKAWRNIKEVPYCFSRSYIKFWGNVDKSLLIVTRIERYRTVTAVWIHRRLRNDAHSLIWCRRGALLFFDVIHQMSRSHESQNDDLNIIFSKNTRPATAIKSLGFALFIFIPAISIAMHSKNIGQRLQIYSENIHHTPYSGTDLTESVANWNTQAQTLIEIMITFLNRVLRHSSLSQLFTGVYLESCCWKTLTSI